ncbi:MAG: aminopeptidase [Desulfobacterota bacterium]|nr:aminopeptidase [Thermodesulfobacteriota bacterium]
MILGTRLLFVLTFLPLLTGCGNLLYLSRLGWHQSFVTFRSLPVEEVLEEEGLDEEARGKVLLIQEVKRFGERRLGLKETGNYTKFFEARGPILFLLTASEKDRLHPHSWHFPIIGRVTYKSIFTLKAALKEKRLLEGRGLDAYLQAAAAYSTLGWLKDPIFSTMLTWDVPTLVNVILHEMVHATIYFKGETDLNEKIATFIANQGTLQFLSERYGPDSREVSLALQYQEDDLLFSRWVEKAYRELSEFYAQPLSREEKLKGREEIFERLREQFVQLLGQFKTDCYRGFEKTEFNNAVILAHRRYVGHLEGFEELYERSGRELKKVVDYFKEIRAKGDWKALSPFKE